MILYKLFSLVCKLINYLIYIGDLMKLTVIGTGYVGLVTGACFAEMGNKVYCVDIDEEKINNLKKGILPIYEKHLDKLVLENYEKFNLYFTTNLKEALDDSDIYFICVGTPMSKDGSCDLSFVYSVAENIGRLMNHNAIIVDKSTVPVGTADEVRKIIQNQLNKRKIDLDFDVVSNPEFLKEGVAIQDSMKPDRVVIGAEEEETIDMMKQLYSPFVQRSDRFIVMDVRSAEMTKYASNAMLATRISFMNEIANICENVDANINNVRLGMGSDERIGYHFLYAGAGYGGSCFPKDIQALIKTAEDNNVDPILLKDVEKINKRQKRLIVEKIFDVFGKDLTGKQFAVWGLSFKPDTDDMRSAPSIVIINSLIDHGAKINAYDPIAIESSKKIFKDNLNNITFFNDGISVLNNSDALILITEWKEFKAPDFEEIGKILKNKIIFDGRNQYSRAVVEDLGFDYYPIGY